jgi:hypothetical protein
LFILLSPSNQKSPLFKARLLLEQPLLNFGDFDCSVYERLPTQSYLRQDFSPVPVSRVFGSIKNNLNRSKAEASSSICNSSIQIVAAPHSCQKAAVSHPVSANGSSQQNSKAGPSVGAPAPTIGGP